MCLVDTSKNENGVAVVTATSLYSSSTAGGVSESEWKETFDMFDKDKSGSISIDEFHGVLHALGVSVSVQKVHDMISKLDKDGDLTLDFEEFCKAMESLQKTVLTREEAQTFFDAFDQDASGYITTAELRHTLTAVGANLDDETMDEIMKHYDDDGSGQLTFDEFVDFVLPDLGYTVVDVEENKAEENETKDSVELALEEEKEQVDVEIPSELAMELALMYAFFAFQVCPFGGADDDDGVMKYVPILFGLCIGWLCVTFFRNTAPASAMADEVALKLTDPIVKDFLKPLMDDAGKISSSELRLAVDFALQNRNIEAKNAETDPALHWTKGREKRGLGKVIHKANHLAITVEDVGRSAAFYSDVIGLQQIRRPDFDRHGAWFTMGNLELHLIKGIPIPPPEDHLVVGHLSIETYNIDEVPDILTSLGVPFRQNISVPKGKRNAGAGTNDSNENDVAVKQYFIRDPDGYYVEVCNCDVLTKYCLGEKKDLAGYGEGIAPLSVEEAVMVSNIGLKIAKIGRNRSFGKQKSMSRFAHLAGASVEEIAQALGCGEPAETADENRLKNLRTRRTVWTDVCQNETDESLEAILKAAGNNMAKAIEIIEIKNGKEHKYIPPAFYVQGTQKEQPKNVSFRKKKSPVQLHQQQQ